MDSRIHPLPTKGPGPQRTVGVSGAAAPRRCHPARRGTRSLLLNSTRRGPLGATRLGGSRGPPQDGPRRRVRRDPMTAPADAIRDT